MSFPRPYHGLNAAVSWKIPDSWNLPSSKSDTFTDVFNTLDDAGNGLPDLLLRQYKKLLRLPRPIQIFFGLNVGAWILWQLVPRFMKKHALANTWNNRQGRWWSMFFASFSHRNLYHIAANMSVLLQYGPLLVAEFGEGVFSSTVLLSALVSGAVPVAVDSFLAWQFPKNERFKMVTPNGDTPETGTLGFSGVGATMIYLFTVLNPETRVVLYIDPPGKTRLLRHLTTGTFLFDCAGLVVSTFLFPTGISHSGHLAGFLCGSLVRNFLAYTETGRQLTSWRCGWKLRQRGPF
ncbi:hypothetical protein B484DRAFT_455410 [Ochromonadaceae sp. CCMP2298]|nr:hypothetical protein B484DRAFT_455410 [Ochromonadaceae sp. CCMP2298]|mmetsp:Transcript_3525/g.8018  ORF Transcript_3525/g.8018 Transcript_3525/m.8018 type:complete len:292 (-) Transcript_3525:119-994(-)